jgi:hypothetical protein
LPTIKRGSWALSRKLDRLRFAVPLLPLNPATELN